MTYEGVLVTRCRQRAVCSAKRGFCCSSCTYSKFMSTDAVTFVFAKAIGEDDASDGERDSSAKATDNARAALFKPHSCQLSPNPNPPSSSEVENMPCGVLPARNWSRHRLQASLKASLFLLREWLNTFNMLTQP